jgi:RNA-dependent RNA polymerase
MFIEVFQDKNGSIVLKHGEVLIHTDGTGLISEDLAKRCPTSVFKGNSLRTHDLQVSACYPSLGEGYGFVKIRKSHLGNFHLLCNSVKQMDSGLDSTGIFAS